MPDYQLVIPARLHSSRLAKKMLREVHGKPLIAHTVAAARKSGAQHIIVATDHASIAEACRHLDVETLMTSAEHASGSDRLCEVVEKKGWHDDQIVVNLQGDEPLMPAVNLDAVAELLSQHRQASISTLHKPINHQQASDPNQVKLVQAENAEVLYFSRSILPFDREAKSRDQGFCGHIGLYAYRAGFLRQFKRLPPSALEQREKLEQLRALANGYRIVSMLAPEPPGPGVDTEADLAELLKLLQP